MEDDINTLYEEVWINRENIEALLRVLVKKGIITKKELEREGKEIEKELEKLR